MIVYGLGFDCPRRLVWQVYCKVRDGAGDDDGDGEDEDDDGDDGGDGDDGEEHAGADSGKSR